MPKRTILDGGSRSEQQLLIAGQRRSASRCAANLFVSIKGHRYAHLRRSREVGRLPLVLAALAELPRLQLEGGLEVLTLMAEQSAPERYAAAAAR